MPFLTDFIPQAGLIPIGGNVGIGNQNPNERLTVSGNISADNINIPSTGSFKVGEADVLQTALTYAIAL